MFSICPSIRPSVRPSRLSARVFVRFTKLVNAIFWKQMNRRWCQLAQVVYGMKWSTRKTTRPKGQEWCLHQALKSNFGLLWPWIQKFIICLNLHSWIHKYYICESTIYIYTVFQKKSCDHVFDDMLNQNSPFTTIFGTLITKGIGHRRVFLFSRLTYFLHRLYLGKLSRPKYQ